MKYYYYWNKLAEKKAQYTYRIENIENELQKILDIGKFNIKVDKNLIKKVSKDVNKREHTKLTWKDLEKEDKDLTNKIRLLAKHYGY